MAELTALESKLGEVLGLAMAAQTAAGKVKGLVAEDGDRELARTLERMQEEAAETEERCLGVAGARDGKKTAILEKARGVRQEAIEMMQTYLGDRADALDGFEFLTMVEAGEAGHWAIVETMARRAGDKEAIELAEWALPMQERHLQEAKQGSLRLAEHEDSNGAG